MSDEQAPRRGSGGEPGPDETRQFSPFEDDDRTAVPGNHPDEGPRSGDAWAPDRTQQMPPVDDATVVTPRDATAVMPPARDWAEPEGAWSGRAEVRPPGPGDYTVASEWDAVPPPTEPRGKWWMPILVGILALILLGLLAWGIYLIAQNSDDDPGTPAPAPSVTAPATVTTEPTTTPPTSEAPTSATPTTTEPTGPTEVTVPALVGLSQEEAQRALDRRGLTYRLIFRPSDAQPRTVIDSDPAEGQEVPPDTQVTLVIAAERTQPATTATTTPPGGPTDEPDED